MCKGNIRMDYKLQLLETSVVYVIRFRKNTHYYDRYYIFGI